MPLETVEDLGVFFGFALTALIVIGQFFLKKRDSKNYIVIAAFTALAVYQFSASFHLFSAIRDWYRVFKWVYISGMFSICMASPLAYMLFSSAVEKEYVFSRKTLLHFIVPAAAALCLMLFADFGDYPGGDPRSYRDYLYESVWIIRAVDIASMILFFAYFARLIVRNRRLYYGSVGKNRKSFLLLLVLTSVAAALCSLYLFDRGDVPFLKTIYRLRFAIIAIFVFLTSYSNPIMLGIGKLESYRDYYQKSYIDNIDSEKIIESLDELMEDYNIFTEDDLTIGKVAESVGITRHQLSEILNHRLHKTFNEYVREKRLAYARRLLTEKPSQKIIWIANECGFNAISNFNNSFKKMYGITPSQYRNRTASSSGSDRA